jgi:putative hydrolase of the HAD superfamily
VAAAERRTTVTITTVGLDGDDTLWHSESHFELTTARLVELLSPWVDADAEDPVSIHDRLIATERRNLALLGYGVKAFTLSMVETAIEVSDGTIPAGAIREIIAWGRELLDHPVELLDGVEDTLRTLRGDYRLVLITKGDLLHQESKIAQSGLEPLFTGIEIISEKDPATYRRVLQRQSVEPASFTMVGNSVRSDVIPVLELGGTAVHVPYHVTWALEHHEPGDDGPAPFPTLASITELPQVLTTLGAERG